MNTRILGGKPIREKTNAAVISVFNIYYKENFLQPCTSANSYQHAGTHLQKATTFSRLSASPGRELQPPVLVYQPLLEGSYDPLLSFTSLSWKGATTPWLKASTLSTTADHVSSIFKLDQTASTQTFTYQQPYFAHCFIQNSETTITRISELTQTSE